MIHSHPSTRARVLSLCPSLTHTHANALAHISRWRITTPKQKVNRAIKEIAGKLKEIDKILTNNIKLKTETGVDKGKYWKSTRKTLYKIAERMSGISEKLRKF